MSLSKWLASKGPNPGVRSKPPRDTASHDGTEMEGARPTGFSRWLDESSEPTVAHALARLRDLPAAQHHTGNVLHPFPVEEHPAYKEHPEVHALIQAAPVRRVAIAGLVSNGQKSVKPEKVAAYVRAERPTDMPSREKDGTKGPPIVVRAGGKDVIFDGHHRATAAYLRGDADMDARYVDLDADGGKKSDTA